MKKIRRYSYFVSYRFASGYGRINIKRRKKITELADIDGIEELISDKNGFPCTVDNFILFRKESTHE